MVLGYCCRSIAAAVTLTVTIQYYHFKTYFHFAQDAYKRYSDYKANDGSDFRKGNEYSTKIDRLCPILRWTLTVMVVGACLVVLFFTFCRTSYPR